MTGLVSPTLGRFDVDRAAERRSDDAWLAQAWADGRVLVLTEKGEAPIAEGKDGPSLQWRDTSGYADDIERVFLGIYEDKPTFVIGGKRDIKADGWMDLRAVGEELSPEHAALLVEAVAITRWHDSHRACPRCGAPTEYVEAGWSTQCTNDGSRHFPRTDPAVIMLVHDGADRCVLGRNEAWPEGRFSVLAGFVEPGETAEQAVRREIHEEVGLRVTDVQYVGSQPWPFPASIMLGFIARVEGSEEIVRNDGEIAEAAWFTKDELRESKGIKVLPTPISIAHHIIYGWLDGELS
ncbi:NAD+ diphosphatase [Antricoccus suffuscus]|uniref:NAD(+) diphosphatase n=1 Tax=Antricoccus suffuscus TaxID=1629062 RepID=A0A2T0ZQG1_9ACTN|nr:NAD(+) diphosphatase [Antricoccus suffuscus]PRZ38547.1 NAD+ diphosphatase [Antricoccus suffuscus]